MLDPAELAARARFSAGAGAQPREVLLAAQRRFLLALVEHAATSVPLYRQSASHRRVAAELRGLLHEPQAFLDCYRTLPILERETLQREGRGALLSDGLRPEELSAMRSSGSTGRPVVVLQTPLERVLYLELRGRTFRRLGVGGGPVAYVGIDSRTAEEKRHEAASRLRVIECRRPLAEVARELLERPFEVLIGYPGVLAELVERGPPGLAERGIRLVVASGEVLTPLVRRLLAEGFGAPVRETYASSECFWMAGSAPDELGLEVVEDGVLLEVQGESGALAGPGEEGEVIVTPLHSHAQPLLRYRLGDRALRGVDVEGPSRPAACVGPFSRLAEVRGRVLDYLVLPDGRRVHAYAFTIPLRDAADFVAQYTLVQPAPDRVLVRLLPSRPPGADELERLRAALAPLLPGVALELALVGELPRLVTGKFRLVERSFEAPSEAR
jgi:phenylacetate-CoA ligase